jgi:hypothetical protein
MDFFYQTSRTINTTTPLGQWNVGGFREVAVHMKFQGAGGAKVFPELYFNGLSAASEAVTIGPAGPGGWNIRVMAKVYPVFAPTLSIVLYNPSAPIDFEMRLYATCCETDFSFLRLLGIRAGPRERIISGTANLTSLVSIGGHEDVAPR